MKDKFKTRIKTGFGSTGMFYAQAQYKRSGLLGFLKGWETLFTSHAQYPREPDDCIALCKQKIDKMLEVSAAPVIKYPEVK